MRYENELFEGETLRLDGNQYIDCRFKDCTFLYAGGPFEVEPFTADGISIQLEGAALSTSRLLHKIQIAKSLAVPVGGQVMLGGSQFAKIANPAGSGDNHA